jgi:hypothetical protein
VGERRASAKLLSATMTLFLVIGLGSEPSTRCRSSIRVQQRECFPGFAEAAADYGADIEQASHEVGIEAQSPATSRLMGGLKKLALRTAQRQLTAAR